MSRFQFAGQESFPDDEYTKEVVYIDVKAEDFKVRLAYVRKVMKNGGSFWDVVSAGAMKHGKKEFLKGAQFSDNFLDKEIKDFLKNRGWEKGQKSQNSNELPF